MITLSPLDVTLLSLYFVVIMFVGYRAARRTSRQEEDYLLAGRSLTLPLFVMTLVSTWYGGILGVGEFTYRYGISNWVVMGLPYYLFAALFALVLAKRIRATNLYSVPDKLHAAYGMKTALLGGILTFILMSPAPYLLMLGLLFHMLFGWNLLVGMAVTAVVAVSYLYVGGLRSDIATDVVEFILMFVGFAVAVPFAVIAYGGWEFLSANLPPLHLVWHGGHSAQYILSWFFIALWTLIDPAFHQRCYAAKDGATAQKGIFISIVFWFIFDGLTLTTGLYARAVLPALDEPMMAYPLLAEHLLPAGVKGLFYIGMLATIMSTLNTLAFVSAQTFGRDMLLRVLRKEDQLPGGESASRYTQTGLIVTFILSAILALAIPSVVQLWYTIGTITIPGLLVPLMASYFSPLNIPARDAFRSMVFGWVTSLTWFVAGKVGTSSPLGIEPMIPGLAVSVVFWVVGRMRRTDSQQ